MQFDLECNQYQRENHLQKKNFKSKLFKYLSMQKMNESRLANNFLHPLSKTKKVRFGTGPNLLPSLTYLLSIKPLENNRDSFDLNIFDR